MIPTRRLIDDWSVRIAELERLQRVAPEWGWLWEIRLKVLRFLSSRYADREVAQHEPAPPVPPAVLSDREDWRPASELALRDTTQAQPRMSHEEIREILDDIHRIAQTTGQEEVDEFSFDEPLPPR